MSTNASPPIETVPISRLFCSPTNPRRNDAAVPHVAASLRRFGWQQPIVARRTGEVIAGNTRLKAAQSLSMTEVPVWWFDGSDLDAVAFNIADNRTHTFSEFDEPALAKLLEALRAEDSLDGVGYSTDDIDALVQQLRDQEAVDKDLIDDGAEAPPAVAFAKLGDLWCLGEHRLLCGDSTNLQDVLRVMDKDKAALCATDPPYLVDYTGERPNDSGKDWTASYREIDIQDADGFFKAVFTNVLEVLAHKGAIYCWHAHKRCGDIQRIWRDLGILDHQQIIWVKPTPVFGRVYWHFRHEPCVMGWRQGDKPEHDGVHDHDSVWECDWDGKARVVGNEHPCLHPDALVLTDAGWRAISTIKVGTQVFAADGAFHSVTDVSSHPYASPALVRIVARGSNVPTLASDNHPFLVWRPNRIKSSIVGGEVSWLRADEVRAGDYTMTPVMAQDAPDPFPERDEEYWFLFGLYLAQGSLQKAGHGENRYPSFALHKKRQDLVNRIHDQWASARDYDPNDYNDSPSQGLTVMAFDPQAGAEFEKLGGCLAHAKRIDPIVLTLPHNKRTAVLQGWLNGDGCRVHNRNYWQGKTCSPDLASHLALLGESVGYRVSVFRYDPPPVLGKIMGRQILSQRAEHHLYFYERGTEGRRTLCNYVQHEGHEYQLRRVKSVERVPYVGDVWNLSVDGCPSFQTSVGMSHNTEKPVELFTRPMKKHTSVGDIVFEPFSGSGSQLIAAERTSRKCRAIEISPPFVDVAIRRWQKATGQDATLHGDGRTFAAVAAERGLS